MLTINNKSIEEKIKQLKKAIEIVGGEDFLKTLKSDDELLIKILESTFKDETFIEVLNIKYSISDLMKIKLDYEKTYIKTKKVYAEKVLYKIKKYNTHLDSLIRKYKKTGGLEEYREVKKEIEIRYEKDINDFILSKIQDASSNNFYGEYLSSKREDFINLLISALV